MAKLYLGSIDLNKIKKSDIVTTDKDGNPFQNGAKYLNIAQYVNDTPDQYGNHVAIKAGPKDASYYIGNAKEWNQQGGSTTGDNSSDEGDIDSLPF